ncbi:MAG: 7-cyano-7-deazaguanine synthase QueC [Eubacteriales bacterium]
MKALVLCSGGVDSTTLLAMVVKQYGKDNVIALSMSYGQKHEKELETAQLISDYYEVEQLFLDLAKIFQYSNCSLLSHSTEELPQGSYGDQTRDTSIPVSSYVPFRNGLFLSTAASIALSKECDVIYYGAHHDDVAGNAYPDCSKEFVDAMNTAIIEGSGNQISIEAPFVTWSKADIIKKGLELSVPYDKTWSCYEGNETPCNTCGTCVDRQKAFTLNGVTDPLCK